MNEGNRHTNKLSGGDVHGAVVQAGAVHGDVHVHTSPARQAVPRQLLPVPASFSGRERELAQLSSVFAAQRGHGPGVAVLAGSGGVGKTTLASRWIADQADCFPDGQLYADLGAFGTTGPTAAEDLLGSFLRAFGVAAEQIPPRLAEQAALYRSVTAGKRLAVLADDADSAAQVRPLLPASPHSVVVVTSRWRLGALAMDGAQVLVVDPLGSAAALSVLERTVGGKRVGAELGPARRLVDLCGGLPIALCVAAARLSTRPHWPIARIVDDLADERRRLSGLSVADEAVVQACFDLSAGELSAETARAYRLLALHPGPDFGTGVAAAAVDRTATETGDALGDLVDASLLADIGPDRYRFHDLTRVHARQQAETDGDVSRGDAVHRMVIWYLDNVVEADFVVTPLRPRVGPRYRDLRDRPSRHPDAAEALDWLERELGNIVAAVDAAADNAWWDETWQFCEGLWSLFLYRKHYRQWARTHARGIDAAHRTANREAEARLRVQLGYACLTAGEHDEAQRFFAAALDIGLATGDRAIEATATEHLGIVAQSSGDLATAIDRYRHALEIAEELGQHRGIALQLRRLGEAAAALDRSADALEYLRRSAETATAIGDSVLRARALTRLGSVRLRLGDAGEATRLLHEATTVLASAGAAAYHAEALEALAEAKLTSGDRAAARTHLELALRIYTAARDPKADRVRARLDTAGTG